MPEALPKFPLALPAHARSASATSPWRAPGHRRLRPVPLRLHQDVRRSAQGAVPTPNGGRSPPQAAQLQKNTEVTTAASMSTTRGAVPASTETMRTFARQQYGKYIPPHRRHQLSNDERWPHSRPVSVHQRWDPRTQRLQLRPSCADCGDPQALLHNCPAKEHICEHCRRKGHFPRLCMGPPAAWLPPAETRRGQRDNTYHNRCEDQEIPHTDSKGQRATRLSDTEWADHCERVHIALLLELEWHLEYTSDDCKEVLLPYDTHMEHDNDLLEQDGDWPEVEWHLEYTSDDCREVLLSYDSNMEHDNDLLEHDGGCALLLSAPIAACVHDLAEKADARVYEITEDNVCRSAGSTTMQDLIAGREGDLGSTLAPTTERLTDEMTEAPRQQNNMSPKKWLLSARLPQEKLVPAQVAPVAVAQSHFEVESIRASNNERGTVITRSTRTGLSPTKEVKDRNRLKKLKSKRVKERTGKGIRTNSFSTKEVVNHTRRRHLRIEVEKGLEEQLIMPEIVRTSKKKGRIKDKIAHVHNAVYILSAGRNCSPRPPKEKITTAMALFDFADRSDEHPRKGLEEGEKRGTGLTTPQGLPSSWHKDAAGKTPGEPPSSWHKDAAGKTPGEMPQTRRTRRRKKEGEGCSDVMPRKGKWEAPEGECNRRQ